MPVNKKHVNTCTIYEATPSLRILLGTNPLDNQTSKAVPNKNELPLTFLSLEYQTKYSVRSYALSYIPLSSFAAPLTPPINLEQSHQKTLGKHKTSNAIDGCML